MVTYLSTGLFCDGCFSEDDSQSLICLAVVAVCPLGPNAKHFIVRFCVHSDLNAVYVSMFVT